MAQSFNLTARINLKGPYNLRPIVSKIKKDIKAIKPELKFKLDRSAASSVKKVTSEIKKLDSAAKSANKSVGSLSAKLTSLSTALNTASAASQKAAAAANSVTKSTSSTKKSVDEARTAIEAFGKQSGLAVKRFAAFTSVTTVIYGVTNAISAAYQEFLVFNKELVRLSQVTNKSVADLKGISNEITRLSTSLGVASSELISVSSTLAQAGLSAEQTKIALEALAKSSLAPSFENIASTTEGAIAALRQFGLVASDLDPVLGSINAVAASFAVEAGDIIAAIQRTGGVFSSASRGITEGKDSLNEFVALFTSVRQTSRESAETIATGLRTIFTRIQRSSTIDLLKEYGVELRDLEGKFVGPFEAVRRLSEGLAGIDPRSADFARISEELGGFRQIGKVIPLIQQFSVAQQALNVAQKGSSSLTSAAITAQQSLAVQFTKTRENFLSLIREIGDTTSFKVFISSALLLTNGLVDLGRTLKPLLPLLLTFGAIKLGSGIRQFASGFALPFGGQGGAGGATGGTSGGGGGGNRGGGGNQPLTTALTLSTTATNALVQSINTLNNSVLALNQNVVNNNSILLNRPQGRGFAAGGLVPGKGNSDTYSARLTPGEFVFRRQAVDAIGADNLAQMNRGGYIQKFPNGSPGGVQLGPGRGKSGPRGSYLPRGFKILNDEEYAALSKKAYKEAGKYGGPGWDMTHKPPLPRPLAEYNREIAKIAFSGIEIPIAKPFDSSIDPKIIAMLEAQGDVLYGTGYGDLAKGQPAYETKALLPFRYPKGAKDPKQRKMDARTLRKMVATAGGVDSSSLENVPMEALLKYAEQAPRPPKEVLEATIARYQKDPATKGGFLKRFEQAAKGGEFISGKPLLDEIPDIPERLVAFRKSLEAKLLEAKDDEKLRKSITDKIIKTSNAIQEAKDYQKGILPTVTGRASHFAWAMRQAIPESKNFANGGLVQKFAEGGVTGIYDGDKIAGSAKQSILGAILDSGKTYDVLHGPAGSGKTTMAQKCTEIILCCQHQMSINMLNSYY